MSWRGRPVFGAAAALISGALLAASRDVGPVGPLILIAPTPVLVYALAARRSWPVAACAFGAQLIGGLSLVFAYGAVLPGLSLASLVLLQALMFTLAVILTRWVAGGAPPWMVLLAYPAFATAAEFLYGLVAPHGSFGAVGYGLVDLLPLLQLASVGGLAALAFAAGLLAMALAMLMANPRDWRIIAIVGGVPLVLALAFGVARLQEREERTVRVALGAIDSLAGRALAGDARDREVAAAYGGLGRALAGDRPDIVVFPEKVFAQVSAPLEAAARETQTSIVAGFDEILPDGRRVNSARVFRAEGPQQRYIKRKLIPGLESGYAVGAGSLVSGGRGVAVCKDMDFAPMIREYGENGVELMLVPAWDFVVDGRFHARMAVVRGVENGFSLARAAADGRLTLSDRYGRIVAEAVTSRDRAVTLVAQLGLRGGGTAYARFGDLFGWLAVATAAWLLGVRILARRRPLGQARNAGRPIP